MPYSRRAMRRSISRSLLKVKHIVDNSTIGANLNTAGLVTTLIAGQDNPVLANANQVATGSKVYRLFIEMNYMFTGLGPGLGVPNVLDVAIRFNPQGSLPTLDPRNVGVDPSKPFVIYQTMLMSQGGSLEKKIGPIKIPKKYARYGNLDVLEIWCRSRQNGGANESFCYKAIFKEIRG